MLHIKFMRTALVALLAGALPALHAADVCKTVSGTSSETIVTPSQVPTDPFGRVLGLFKGDFAGVANVSLSAILVTPPGFSSPAGASTVMEARHVFLTGPGDTVITLGKVVFNAAPATQPGQTNFVSSVCPFAPCVVQNPQLLKIIGGTGRWTGATGQLNNLGLGNLDLPAGKGTFVYIVKGEVCVPGNK
jgi:hypothetical protein